MLNTPLAIAALLLPAIQDGAAERTAAGPLHWHPSFEAASTAAAASGKPILLFELFGRLDEERC